MLGNIVGGLLSGFLRKSAEKRARREQRDMRDNGYKYLRDAALRAGFNPLTVLRNGGGAAASSSMFTTPILSSNEFIGQAIGQGIDAAFGAGQRKRDEERDILELEMMRTQLAGMKQNQRVTASQDFGYNIPSATTYTGITHGPTSQVDMVSDRAVAGAGVSSVDVSNGDGSDTRLKPITYFGFDLTPTGRTDNADHISEQAGEPAEWLSSPLLALDYAIGTAQRYVPKFAKRAKPYMRTQRTLREGYMKELKRGALTSPPPLSDRRQYDSYYRARQKYGVPNAY